jgi:fermentation-respiration switch protein FrsA (DUF1100 family)
MRTDIESNAEVAMLRGWVYRQDDAPGPSPVVVMAHGVSAVKEQDPGRLAEPFAALGLARAGAAARDWLVEHLR